MTHLPEIWDCIVNRLPKKRWFILDDIYTFIECNMKLDEEDYEWQSPTSNIPKWKRNVRNVLQYRKRTREIEWDRQGHYRL
jgi:hypothetical protein